MRSIDDERQLGYGRSVLGVRVRRLGRSWHPALEAGCMIDVVLSGNGAQNQIEDASCEPNLVRSSGGAFRP
jgi:hypothetical protein